MISAARHELKESRMRPAAKLTCGALGQPIASRLRRERGGVVDLARRIASEDGGSVYATGLGNPHGWIVSITSFLVRDDIGAAVDRVRRFAMAFSRLNPEVAGSLIIGWWRSAEHHLYVDLGLIVPTRDLAFAVATAFRQEAVANVGDGFALIVSVDTDSVASEPRTAPEVCP